MLKFFKKKLYSRVAWLLIALTALVLEILPIWFQYGIGLKPCVLCIYERCALLGIVGAGLIGSIAPKTRLRYIAIVVWLYSAWKGIELTWKHITIQSHPLSPFCDFSTHFFNWFPLDKWLPQMFVSSDKCSIHQWKFLTLEIREWLMGVFVVYFFIALLGLIAQLSCSKYHDSFDK